MFLFAAKKEPKNRRRFRRGGRTTKGPAGPLESLRLAPGDPVRFGQGNARLAVQAHAPETPVFRPPIENGEQRFPIPLRGRLLQASIRPELPEEGKRFSARLNGTLHILHTRCGKPGRVKGPHAWGKNHQRKTTGARESAACAGQNHPHKATEPEISHPTPMA